MITSVYALVGSSFEGKSDQKLSSGLASYWRSNGTSKFFWVGFWMGTGSGVKTVASFSSQSQTVPHPGKPSLSLPLQTEWRKHSLRENNNFYLILEGFPDKWQIGFNFATPNFFNPEFFSLKSKLRGFLYILWHLVYSHHIIALKLYKTSSIYTFFERNF